ncbi:MAG: hypothetical protein JHD15_02460 [Phenylobacterium sp.]|jgi:hypothetical protein|uniref:hypothetical protein n=1 Tax=Phenylobacterium sp. TaxID=1871053 RepID=UPI001A24CD4F|nr:hypothetical protein [Phenylobacterium sp.]MBJ7409216.1 hypothetical protein [Phenylobacterium sp.]
MLAWLPTLFELVASVGDALFMRRALAGRPVWLRVVLVAAWLVLALGLAAGLLLIGAVLVGLVGSLRSAGGS